MVLDVFYTAICGANLLLQQYGPTDNQILSGLKSMILHHFVRSTAYVVCVTECRKSKKSPWLTSHPSMTILWTTRVITSSLQTSSASCEICSALGSTSPSPTSIHLIVTKFFSTSSKACNQTQKYDKKKQNF